MSKDQFVEIYLEERRKDELEIAKRVAAVAECSTGKLWILSVVSKEDLWINARGEVDNFYKGEGTAYSEIFRVLGRAKNAKEFRFEHVSVCMSITSLETGRSEKLRPNSEGYGTPQQAKSLENLIKTIGSLVDWES
ncbi:MAG: hypothetical protein H7A48_09695 [Akkermansiaceae bacterium]|nr:hypothetical protein [Akkermansiaceae bacterium]MCP5549240.1 hypothetical protein [Akkermansiaceae bacterium]